MPTRIFAPPSSGGVGGGGQDGRDAHVSGDSETLSPAEGLAVAGGDGDAAGPHSHRPQLQPPSLSTARGTDDDAVAENDVSENERLREALCEANWRIASFASDNKRLRAALHAANEKSDWLREAHHLEQSRREALERRLAAPGAKHPAKFNGDETDGTELVGEDKRREVDSVADEVAALMKQVGNHGEEAVTGKSLELFPKSAKENGNGSALGDENDMQLTTDNGKQPQAALRIRLPLSSNNDPISTKPVAPTSKWGEDIPGSSFAGASSKAPIDSPISHDLHLKPSPPSKNPFGPLGWTAEEDSIILEHGRVHGNSEWSAVVDRLDGRKISQIRNRWLYTLDPSLIKGEFTEEEDRKILEFHQEFGNKWSIMATKIPGRSDVAIKQRYRGFEKRIEKYLMQKHRLSRESEIPRTSEGNFDFGGDIGAVVTAIRVNKKRSAMSDTGEGAATSRSKKLKLRLPPITSSSSESLGGQALQSIDVSKVVEPAALPDTKETRLARSKPMWYHKFEKLRKSREKYGNANSVLSDDRMKIWLQSQRSEYRKYQKGLPSSLTADMAEALKDIESVLGLDYEAKRDAEMEKRRADRYELLRKFHETHGHLSVKGAPSLVVKAAASFRSDYMKWKREGTEKYLTRERREALERMGFEFERGAAHARQLQAKWDRQFEELRGFHATHGHFEVDYARQPDLFNWINAQKNAHKKGQLKDDRRIALEGLGLNLQPADEDDSQSEDEEDDGGSAEDDELSALSSTAGSAAINVSLDSVDVVTSRASTTWDIRFRSLQKFYKENGHFDVPNTKTHKKLKNFVNEQRSQYRKHKRGGADSQTDEQRALLQSLGFPWEKSSPPPVDHEVEWNEGFNHLVVFKNHYGHCNPSSAFHVYKWTTKQRQRYKKKKAGVAIANPMTDEQQKKLIDLGFVLDPVAKAAAEAHLKWEEKVQQLENFIQTHGHYDVPESDKELRNWLQYQFSHYRKLMKYGGTSSLTPQRIARLKEIGVDMEDPTGMNKKGNELQYLQAFELKKDR